MRRVSLRAGDLTPGPPPRSPPPFHFPRDSQPVWRRRLLPGSQGIPGRPRRRAGRAGPAALACLSRRARPAAFGRGGGGRRCCSRRGRCPASRRRRGGVFRLPPPSVSSSNYARRGCVCLQLLQALLPPHPPPRRGPGVRPGRGGGGDRRAAGGWAGLDPECASRTNLCGLLARSWGRVGAEAAGPQCSVGPAGSAHGSRLGPRGARAHRRPDRELQVPTEGWLARLEEPACPGWLRTISGEEADLFRAPVTSRTACAQWAAPVPRHTVGLQNT